ncbi:MAG: M16 family metallopeptidase [Myxococcaceae bacterium]
MRRLIALCLLATACATPGPVKEPELITRQHPPLEGTAQRPQPTPGYFPLPAALAHDPTKLPIAPLDFKVVKPEKVTLDNGLSVYLMEDHTVPLVSLRALVAAGSFDDPAGKVGTAALAFDLLVAGGSGALPADELDELLEFHAADASGGAGEEYSSVNLSLRSVDLDRLFPVFTDLLLRPRFQKDRFEVTVARYVESVRRRPDSPDGLASRALKKAVFGPDSLLGREATEGSLRAISLEDLHSFHKMALVPRATSILVTGDFERAAMLARVKKILGAWTGGERIVRSLPAPPPLARRVILVPKQTAQAKIRIGGFGYPRRSPREYAFRVANTALGSFGVGRIYKEVRDVRGLAYSAYSSVSPGPTTGLFFAGADTKPATAAQAIGAMLEILEDTGGRKPITPAEVSTAADMYLNSFAFRFDSPEKIVREKAVFDLFGYPEDYLDSYREKMSAVDAAAAGEAAKDLGKLGELQIVVVGPPDGLGDLSRFGPVTTITDVEAFR